MVSRKWIAGALTAVALAAAAAATTIVRPDRAVRVATGYVAHNVCSKTFVSGFDPQIVFAETSTLGLRMSRWERICLERDWVNAETPWGSVRVKIGRCNGRVLTRAPEYDDCKRVAQQAGVPLKEVQAAALGAVAEG